MFGFLILRISNRSFMWDPLLRLYWIANTPAIASFYKCNRTDSSWPKSPYGFGVDTTIFGCGRSFLSTPRNPTFGLWSLNSTVATSIEYSVHLSVFQLSKGPYSSIQASSRQFGTFSLWRKLRWKSTPTQVRRALHSPIFGHRVQLWEIIQDLGSNSIRRFHMEKRLRSNEVGLHGCYFIRRLANNLGEPQRSYAINAIDRALKFWKGKRVRKPIPLRAPWLLATNWTRNLRQLLTAHVHVTKQYNTTLQHPSTGIVFTKFPSVMDSLCNHKEAATRWADGETPVCACSALRQYSSQPQLNDQHLVLGGDTLHFTDLPFTPIATGSLQNKIFPPSKEIYKSLRSALTTWTTRNSLPSLQCAHLDNLWTRSLHSHRTSLQNHITHKDIMRFKQVFHNEDKRATSLRIYCPKIYYQCLTKTFADPLVFRKLDTSPTQIIETPTSTSNLANHTLGHLELDAIYQMHMSCRNARNSSCRADLL